MATTRSRVTVEDWERGAAAHLKDEGETGSRSRGAAAAGDLGVAAAGVRGRRWQPESGSSLTASRRRGCGGEQPVGRAK